VPSGKRKVLVIVREITERKMARERLMQLAHYDELTGLPNRVLLLERLDHAISQAEGSQGVVALLYINLNRFNLINENLGHDAGDELLSLVAHRLTECVSKSASAARLGSADFAVVLEGIHGTDEAARVARELGDACEQPFIGETLEYHTGVSTGIAIYPFDERAADELLKAAATALYRTKEQSGNGFNFYTAEMSAQVQGRLALDSALRHALEQEQFVLHYQPQVDLATGRIVGSEALLRWQSPERGLVSPLEFIPILEDTGLIGAVGEWVLREACLQHRAWQEAGVDTLSVSVNLSGKQFNNRELSNRIMSVLEDARFDPRFLELEITESVVMEDRKAAEDMLDALHAAGIRISIDDFGTGYSSLANLKRLPLHTLKLDRSFVKGIPDNSDDVAITKAMLALADSLHLKVVAEGVENREQLRFLIDQGCALMQGFYFSRPLPADAFWQLLQEDRNLPVAE
jgi:diguanylate cyclase (GGDEF)-like protein